MHALLLVATLAAAPTHTTTPVDDFAQRAPQARVAGRVLLKLRGIDDARALKFSKAGDDSARALAALGRRHGVELTFVRASLFGWAVVDVRVDGAVPDEADTLAIVTRLAKDAAVDLAAEETWMKKLATPNDPGIPQMWHLDQIGAKSAWDTTVGTSGQRVGVADTGVIRNHEDLRNRIITGFDFVADPGAGNDGNGRDGDFNDAGDACNGPASFHGTHVAGTIGAEANNAKGIAGLNWNAGLVIARVLGRCGGSSVDIMEGAAWMAGAHIDGIPDIGANKVSVMNLSLGSSNRCSAFEQQFVTFINQQGVLFVAAAGNDGGAVGAPANCAGAIAVAATGPTNRKASYSSFGPEIAIVAPGGDGGGANGVLSTIGPNNTGYTFQNGTSMASPHVAGAISLLQSLRPSITRTEAVNLLRSTGAVCSGCQGVPAMRIGAAVASIGGAPQQPPPAQPPPTTSLTDDVFENNDTPATATRGRCGVNDARPVAVAGDQDWYTFTPPVGAQLAIEIDGGQPDLDLYVTNSTGQTILARSEGNTGVERITGRAGGGALMILVNPYTDQQRGIANEGPYRLTITCSQTAAANAVDVAEEEVVEEEAAEEDGFEAGDPFEEVVGAEEGSEIVVDDAPAVEDAGEDVVVVDAPQAQPMVNAGTCQGTPLTSFAPGALVGLLLLRRRRR